MYNELTFELSVQGGCQTGLFLIRRWRRGREQQRESPVWHADVQARAEQATSVCDDLSLGLELSKHPLHRARDL